MSVKLDDKGREIVDPTPSRIDVRRHKMVGLSDQMRQTVMQMRHEAAMAERDSLEDEKDFDLPDDEPRSPHELFVESPEYEIFLDDIQTFARKKKEEAAAEEDAKKTPSPAKPKASKAGNPPEAAQDEE